MRSRTWIAVAAVLAVVFAYQLLQDGGSRDAEIGTPAAVSALPPAALETIALIEEGGPFPYSRDGTVFMNREGLLPDQPTGYWHEYTVPTPGETGRGARRIVHGEGGEFYYTGDHYASFTRVKDGAT